MKLLVLLLFGWICPEVDAQTVTIANSGQSASSEPSNALVRPKRSEEQKQKMLDRHPNNLLKKCCEYGFRYSPSYMTCEAYAENTLRKAPQSCRAAFRDCCLFHQRHRYDDFFIGPRMSEEPHTNHSGCTLQDFQQSDVFDENFNVSVLKQSYDSGSKVGVPCKIGFRGFIELLCSNGQWIHHGSKCRPILCPSLTVDNNVLVYGDLDHPISGSVLQFNCSSREELVGPTQIVCDDYGNWDTQPPTCRETPLQNSEVEREKIQACSRLPTFEHAFVPAEYTKAEYYKGDVIYMSCDPGYTTGLNTTYMCTERGWRALTIGQCIEMDFFPVLLGCAPPPPLKNGRIFQPFSTMKIYVYVDGQRVHFQCDPLYRLTGGPHITCSNGQWTGEVQCLPK